MLNRWSDEKVQFHLRKLKFEKNVFSSPQATNSTVSSIFEAHRTIEMKVKKELFNIRNQPYFTHHFFTSQSCNDVRK